MKRFVVGDLGQEGEMAETVDFRMIGDGADGGLPTIELSAAGRRRLEAAAGGWPARFSLSTNGRAVWATSDASQRDASEAAVVRKVADLAFAVMPDGGRFIVGERDVKAADGKKQMAHVVYEDKPRMM